MELINASISKNCKKIKAQYDSMKDWRADRAGYFLIRVNPKSKNIELGFCKQKNIIDLLIVGDNAEEIYHTFANQGITIRPDHMSYLGKELHKAELAKRYKKNYIQDQPLHIE